MTIEWILTFLIFHLETGSLIALNSNMDFDQCLLDQKKDIFWQTCLLPCEFILHYVFKKENRVYDVVFGYNPSFAVMGSYDPTG